MSFELHTENPQRNCQEAEVEESSKMPTLNLFTNVPVDAVVTSDILKDATKAVAKIIGKPESVKFPFSLPPTY